MECRKAPAGYVKEWGGGVASVMVLSEIGRLVLIVSSGTFGDVVVVVEVVVRWRVVND